LVPPILNINELKFGNFFSWDGSGHLISLRDTLGITNPNEVVTCYAKYIPVHGLQVTGVLTIASTRIIFEPNLDDPGVSKDGTLAHQFSVETGRLLEVGI
jgi:hypothetical protein